MEATLLPLLDPVTARQLHFDAPPLPVEYLYQVPAFSLIALALSMSAKSVPTGVPGRTSFIFIVAGALAVLAGYFVLPPSAAWPRFAARFRRMPMT